MQSPYINTFKQQDLHPHLHTKQNTRTPKGRRRWEGGDLSDRLSISFSVTLEKVQFISRGWLFCGPCRDFMRNWRLAKTNDFEAKQRSRFDVGTMIYGVIDCHRTSCEIWRDRGAISKWGEFIKLFRDKDYFASWVNNEAHSWIISSAIDISYCIFNDFLYRKHHAISEIKLNKIKLKTINYI